MATKRKAADAEYASGPSPAELADTLTACADALTAAAVDIGKRLNTDPDALGHLRALQAVEPAVRAAGLALAQHAEAVQAALDAQAPEAEKEPDADA